MDERQALLMLKALIVFFYLIVLFAMAVGFYFIVS
jgi:hypothetical protein